MNISFGILSGPGALLFLSCFIVVFSYWIVTLCGGLHVLLWLSSSLIFYEICPFFILWLSFSCLV